MPCFSRAGRHGQLHPTTMCGKQRLKIAWAVYKSYGRSYGLASPSAQAAAVAVAASPSGQDGYTQPSTAQVSDNGLEVFKALIGQKRFICTQCGKCCTGDGEVWVSDAEVTNIAKYLNMPLKHFIQQHTRAYSKVEGFRMLKSKLEMETRDCTFLRADNTCAIHPVRPLQCSTYPWWPDLLDDQEWTWEKANVCEGFDHPDAPPTDVTEAARQLKLATIQEYQKRMGYKPSKKQQKAAAAAAAAVAAASAGCTSSAENSSTNGCSGGGSESGTLHGSDGTTDLQGSKNSNSMDSSNNSSSSSPAASTAAWQEKLKRLQQPTK